MLDPLKKFFLERIVSIKNEYKLSDEVFELAKEFSFLIADEKINPMRITDLYEEGYVFQFIKNDHIVYFEIYEDCEFGYITVDEKNNHKIIDNKDITELRAFIEYMKR
jgi:hypothetical protein